MKIVSKFVIAGAAALALSSIGSAGAQTPVRGGTLTYGLFAAFPTTDCHALGSAALMPGLAPAYSTLLRFDPDNFPAVKGDLAESFTTSPDRKTFTFKLRSGVKFHDGSAFSSADIKATFDRLRDPPQGVVSLRKSLFATIDTIETPDAQTVVFKLNKSNPAFPLAAANPLNCVYSAAKLKDNPKYPETTIMGTGPFKIAELVPGASISYTRNENYFMPGLPYLDGLKGIVTAGPALVTSIQGAQVDAVWNQMTFVGRDQIKAVRGDGVVFPSAPFSLTNMFNVNTTKAPLNDKRVRQALNLALDRRAGDKMMQQVSMSLGFGLYFSQGSPMDMPTDMMMKQPGLGPDVAASREKAKKLLAEAGVKDLKLTLLNRNVGEPYSTLGIFVVDQLRQIGVTVEQRIVESGAYFSGLSGLNFDIAIDANSFFSNDPSEVLIKFLPESNINYTGFKDLLVQDMYDKQAVEEDPAKRRAIVNQIQERILDEASVVPMFLSINMGAVDAKVKGWKILPNSGLNVDFRDVWKVK